MFLIRSKCDSVRFAEGSIHRLNSCILQIDTEYMLGIQLLDFFGPNPEQIIGIRKPHRSVGVASHIQKNYQETIRIEDLARIANLSVSQLQRKFKKIYNETPVQYINNLRIHEACEMLKNTNLSITQIAYDCGFGSSSFFATQFRQARGESPSDYRRKFA